MSSLEDYRLEPGHLLAGTYRIERPLGRGGMGEVYEVSHARLSGRYAVKLLLREIGQNEEALQRFKQEAEVTSRLRHPNVVQVIDFAQMPDGTPFMVMEFLEGRDLVNELGAVGRLPLARVVDLVDQVATGLAAAHAENIVHRDLKPANIFLVPLRGRQRELAKIVDFGISKVRALTGGLTRTQAVIGTPQYMSPEQARGQIRDIDSRTDQFALGAIAYELITGRPAFEGDQVSSILYQVVHEEPPALATLGFRGLEAVEVVIRKAMAKAADARYANVNDFAQALEAAWRGTSSAAAGPAVALAPPPFALARRTAILSPASEPESVKNTTLRESAGELAAVSETTGSPRRAPLALALAGVAALGVGGFLVFTRAQKTATAPVAAEAPVPPASATSQAETAASKPSPPATIVVEIAMAPPGLRAQIDGREVGLPIKLTRDEHAHRLTLSAPGYASKAQWVTADHDIVVTPALVEAAPSPRSDGKDGRKDGKKSGGSHHHGMSVKSEVVTDL